MGFTEDGEENPRLGDYEILGLLGEGGMGEVYEAVHTPTNRRMALKVISELKSGSEKAIKRFQMEAQTLSKVSHPYVVSVYEVGEVKGTHFIAMTLVEGMPLNEIAPDRPLPLSKSLPIFLKILEGVRALHQVGVIHRDLKPANILYCKDGTVRIIDFGISKDLYDADSTRLTATGKVVGSVHYLAPEQLKGGKATIQSDIWSLGVLFFELLTGKNPFGMGSFVDVARRVNSQPVVFPPEIEKAIPPRLKEIILSMCIQNAQFRAKSVDIILNDMRAMQTEMVRGKTQPQKVIRAKREFKWPLSPAMTFLPLILFAGYYFFPKVELPNNLDGVKEKALAFAKGLSLKKVADDKINNEIRGKFNKGRQTEADMIAHAQNQYRQKELNRIIASEKPASAISREVEAFAYKRPSVDRKKKVFSENQALLQWGAVEGALGYEIQISPEISFYSQVETFSSLKPEYSLQRKAANSYYWRVRAIHPKGLKSNFSDVGKFLIPMGRPKVQREWSLNVAGAGKPAPFVSWQPSPQAKSYLVAVSRKADMKNLKTYRTNSPRFAAKFINPGYYFLQVAYLNKKGQPISPYSEVMVLEMKRPQRARRPARSR